VQAIACQKVQNYVKEEVANNQVVHTETEELRPGNRGWGFH